MSPPSSPTSRRASTHEPVVGDGGYGLGREGAGSEPLSFSDRVERALIFIAWCLDADGDIHLLLFERLEGELAALRKKDATRERAKRLLAERDSHPF